MAVLNDGEVVVGIVDEPCTSEKVKPMIKEEFFPRFKAGRVVFKGMDGFDLCWADGNQFMDVEPGLKGMILVFDELGNYGPIPVEVFYEAKENPMDDRNLRKPMSI
jgi:hypothetical protein